MATFTPSFKPTSKRRSFRPSAFQPLNSTQPASLATLSENLRASLMNVGMRVRKSVPEGYKTSHSKPSFSIYEQTAASHPELASFAGTRRSSLLLPPVELSRSSSSSSRRLANDENAMTDEQVAQTVDDVLSGLDADLAGFFPSSSQESMTSVADSARMPGKVSRASLRRKRTVGEGDESEQEEEGLWGGVPMERDTPLRQIAQPRSRRPGVRRNRSSEGSTESGGKSRKNVRFANKVEDEDDFGEADFLMPDRN